MLPHRAVPVAVYLAAVDQDKVAVLYETPPVAHDGRKSPLEKITQLQTPVPMDGQMLIRILVEHNLAGQYVVVQPLIEKQHTEPPFRPLFYRKPGALTRGDYRAGRGVHFYLISTLKARK